MVIQKRAQIADFFKEEYNRRLSKVGKILSDIKPILKDRKAFIAGGYAAYAIGRFEEYGDLDIFVLGKYNNPLWIERDDWKLMQDEEYLHGLYLVYEKEYKDPNIKVQIIIVNTDIQSLFRRFDLDVISVFINMFDFDEIYSIECKCVYDDRGLDENDIFFRMSCVQTRKNKSMDRNVFKNLARPFEGKHDDPLSLDMSVNYNHIKYLERVLKYVKRAKNSKFYALKTLIHPCPKCGVVK